MDFVQEGYYLGGGNYHGFGLNETHNDDEEEEYSFSFEHGNNADGYDPCLIAQFHQTDKQIVIVPSSNCSVPRGIICKSKAYDDYHYDLTKTLYNFFCGPVGRQGSILKILFYSLGFDDTMPQDSHSKVSARKTLYKDMLKRLDQTKAFDAIISSMWYASLPCIDIGKITSMYKGERSTVKYCEWKGMPITCAAIFSAFPTDQGMCCAFNMKAANDIYQGGRYSEKITALQEADQAASFENSTKPGWYIDGMEPIPLPGKGKGLFLMLDAHSDLKSKTTIPNDFDGFNGLLHPSGSFPFMALERFEIKPGHLNAISITPTRIEADDSLKDLDVSSRQCMFEDDSHDLQIHQKYSYLSCIFECRLRYAREQARF